MSVPVLSMADIPVNVESVHSVVSGASGDMTRARVRAGGGTGTGTGKVTAQLLIKPLRRCGMRS